MLSLLLALTIFLFVMVLGKALLVAFRVGLPVLLGWLVAPSLGTALVITAVVNLNQCDVPVGRFGPTLLITLLVFIAVVFLWRRPRFPWPYLGFFLLTAVFSLFYTGWPALINGFKWLSYGNDDMANYCVAATRFLHQGFYTLPTYRAIDGLDYSQDYWFMHVQDLMRPGSEEFLAWIASVTGLHPMHIFMPTALAFSFCQIFAAASLILCISIQYRRLALLAATLLAISPLFSLGTLYQLITQQIGIGLLCASLSLIVWVCLQCRFSWPRLVLTALLVNGLCLFYPEVAPFFVLSLVLFIGVWTVKSRLVAARLVIRVALIGLLTFILLNKNLAMFLITMLSQSHGAASTGVTGERFVLFPWSLVPSSWAMLWGFIPFGRLWTEPFNSIAIAWGILYFAVVIVFALLALKRAQIWSCLLVVMAALGFWLFHIDQDFGLFKLHMYIQPALMVGLAAVVVAYFRSTRALVGAVAVFFLATCWTQNKYTAASAGIINSGLNEIQGVSRLGMDFPVPSDFHDRFFLLENSNPTLAKLTCSLLKGCPTKMIGRDVFNSISGGTAESRQFDLETWRVNSYLPEDMVLKADVIARQLKIMRTSGDDLVRLKSALSPIVPKEVFAEPPRPQDLIKHMFDTDFIDVSESFSGYPERTTIVSGPSEYEQFNKFNPPSYQPNDSFVRFTPLTDIHNYLVFIHTPRGSHYYSGGRLNASFFQREPDCFDSNYYFNGMGRFTLFRVLQPTPNFRLRIMLTRTIMGSGRNQLPPQATLTGDSVHSIPWIGSGAACVITDPITPLMDGNEAYVALDMGIKGEKFHARKSGLMKLYNESYTLDDRRLVAYCRDISAISEEQYQHLVRPASIDSFPLGLLAQPNLEYSGVYEDGWVSPDSFYIFGQSSKSSTLKISGSVPGTRELLKGTVLSVSVNGKQMQSMPLPVGPFHLEIPLIKTAAKNRIELHFAQSITLGSQDPRLASARLTQIGLY